ncbi:MAG: VCBS repeat-containing protein [Planctomycetota bacterium]|nr:VCBS repeat-containing protein [Planctomycetota bacterium]
MPANRRLALIVAALFLLLPTNGGVALADNSSGVWTENSYEDFSDGTFGNAGQNIYVSRDGVLQRIFQFDFNNDSWLDLLFCTSQDHWEKPPAYIYSDPLGKQSRIELPADGSMAGTVADLNGDGLEDIVLGMRYNGIRKDLNAYIYFASPDGYSQRRHLRLPAPVCRSLAAGDFNGDGRVDLAFQLSTGLRVFYQTQLGFEPRRYSTLALRAVEIAADDLDGDGRGDLAARISSEETRIFWGGKNGLDLKSFAAVKVKIPPRRQKQTKKYAEYVLDAGPLVGVVRLGGKPYVSMLLPESVRLVPVGPFRKLDQNRKFGKPIELACLNAMSIAGGDVNGDGHQDLVLACREPLEGKPKADPPVGLDQRSWIYWGGPDGYSETNRTALASHRACDVAVGDLNGDGIDDVVLCQCHRAESFTADCLVYRGRRDGPPVGPVALRGEDARRVFLVGRTGHKKTQVLLVNHCSRNKWGNRSLGAIPAGPGRSRLDVHPAGKRGEHRIREVRVSKSLSATVRPCGTPRMGVRRYACTCHHLSRPSWACHT